MHEHTLVKSLYRQLDALCRAEGGARITRVEVTLGAFSHISAAHFREHFEHEQHETLAKGAELVVHENADIHHPHASEIVINSIEVDTEGA
jgi:Zn finger protein HypA/HybF involved in hydrogenase expression